MLEILCTFCSILDEVYTQKRQNANVMQVFIIVCLYIARLLRIETENILRQSKPPLYRLYRYVRPQRVWFFSRFSHK